MLQLSTMLLLLRLKTLHPTFTAVNKKAFTFNLVKTSDNSFNSRLKLNKKPLKEGEYTICVEFFYPKNKNDQNWFLNPLNKLAASTITYHTKRFATT